MVMSGLVLTLQMVKTVSTMLKKLRLSLPKPKRLFKEKVFKAVIPRNIRLAEAPSHGLPGVRFDPGSRGALGYLDFASELIERTPAYVAQMKSAAQARAGQQAAPQARDTSHAPAGSTNAPTQADETADAQNPSTKEGSTSGHGSEAPADSHTEESQANAG